MNEGRPTLNFNGIQWLDAADDDGGGDVVVRKKGLRSWRYDDYTNRYFSVLVRPAVLVTDASLTRGWACPSLSLDDEGCDETAPGHDCDYWPNCCCSAAKIVVGNFSYFSYDDFGTIF